MSFSRPGPKRDDALSAVVGGKALEPRSGLVAPDDDAGTPRTAEEAPSSAGPRGQQRLLQHEQARLAALGAGDRQLADNALRDVIGELEVLLASAATELRTSASGRRTRKQVKKAAPRLVAIDELGCLPLVEVAELLGLTRDDVDGVLASLVARGEFSTADRNLALGHIEQVRLKLREIEVSRNHSMLSGLLDFIVKLFLLVTIAVAAAPLGALAVGDPVLAEAIKTGIIALVAVALQQTFERVRDWHAAHEPYAVAQRAREDLLTELTLAKNLTKTPAYEGEHVVLRFRLHVRCATARVSSIPLDWPDKPQYWQLLDQIALALTHEAPKTLVLIRRKLEATPIPKG